MTTRRTPVISFIIIASLALFGYGTGNVSEKMLPCEPETSPHRYQKESCRCCHLDGSPGQSMNNSAVKPGGQRASSLDIESICRRCHSGLSAEHYQSQNPFNDPEVINYLPAKSPNSRQILCTACHTPHGEDHNVFLLSNQYFRLCQLSRSINPHWRELMCNACHLERFPVRGRARLLCNGDINSVCNRCHRTHFARREIHPVGMAPSRNIKVPTDMVLTEGRLTCATCHHCELQKSILSEVNTRLTNRNFLRHSSLSRAQYCFLCHVNESYSRLNPHKQLDEQGKIKEETCLFCHASRPDLKLDGPEQVTFIMANPVSYCIGCHPGFEHKHPSGGEHLVEPSALILQSLATSIARIGVELPLFNNRIVCTTCHNPHEQGVIQVAAAAEGAQHKHKLRLVPGRNQCTGCHWDK